MYEYKVPCWICFDRLTVLDDPKKPRESDPDAVIALHIKAEHS